MNRSYSKLRHIQESNIKLEKRLLKEQTETKVKLTQNWVNWFKSNKNINSGTYDVLPNGEVIINSPIESETQRHTRYKIILKVKKPDGFTKESGNWKFDEPDNTLILN